MPSPFRIHDKFIRDNELRQAGGTPAPADRQITRTRLKYNSLGQVTKVVRFTTTTVISQTEFTYDVTGRLTEPFDSVKCTRKVIVYDEYGKFEETITYRVVDR